MTDDPLEARREKRARQGRNRLALLVGLAWVVGLGVGVVGTTLIHRRQPGALSPAPANNATAPAEVPESAAARPGSREITVTGVVVVETIDIESFLDANEAATSKKAWSAEPVLYLKRQGEPDVACYFPRNSTGELREVSHLLNPRVTVTGVIQEPRNPAVWVLRNCRIMSVERR